MTDEERRAKLQQASDLLAEVFDSYEGWNGDDVNEHRIVANLQNARSYMGRARMRIG